MTQVTYPDLPETDVFIASRDAGFFDCRIVFRGENDLRFTLLPEKMVCTASDSPTAPTDNTLVAFGRVLASHSAEATSRDILDAQFDNLELIGDPRTPATWPDLPEVRVSPIDIDDHFACCGVRSQRCAATLFLTVHTLEPLAHVDFSDVSPDRPLLLAVGRMITEHARGIRAADAHRFRTL